MRDDDGVLFRNKAVGDGVGKLVQLNVRYRTNFFGLEAPPPVGFDQTTRELQPEPRFSQDAVVN